MMTIQAEIVRVKVIDDIFVNCCSRCGEKLMSDTKIGDTCYNCNAEFTDKTYPEDYYEDILK